MEYISRGSAECLLARPSALQHPNYSFLYKSAQFVRKSASQTVTVRFKIRENALKANERPGGGLFR